MSLERGAQVLYIPSHAGTEPEHPDTETGFVTSFSPGGRYVWVRYWYRGAEGVELRTKSCSESTPINRLWPMGHWDTRWVDPTVIDQHLTRIAEEEIEL